MCVAQPATLETIDLSDLTSAPQTAPSRIPFGLSVPTGAELRTNLLRGVILILPMPAMLLDFMLAVSIIFSVLIMMTALFIQTPLEFTAFPTILLISTMLRLSLNLASTRLILSHGHEGTDAAGHVIEAFGAFVMGGNFVIGIIVFGILVIVNFIVITKGSGRIAEVAARFNLDAMPGKQMAIDADLSSGLIKEDEARKRRKDLESESAFFGAMDGASKFVRGDAIAGLLITFINVIGGIIIGTMQMGITLSEAGHSYTVLSVGDGLVSQIPALIVSTAAGLLVSKAGVSGAADKALSGQLTGYPAALGLSGAVMGLLSLLPGLPFLPFAALGAGAGGLALWAKRENLKRRVAAVTAKAEAEAPPPPPAEEPIATALKMDDLRVELGYGLLPLINDNGKGGGEKLSDQIKALRRQIASDLGYIMPPVRLLDNVQLAANEYVIKIKEVDAGKGTLYPGQYMVMDPMGGKVTIPGTQTTEPTFGLPATWVDGRLREEAAIRGYTVVDPATVLSTHLSETLKTNVSELLSYADVKKLLSEVPSDQAKLIDEIVPSQITVSGIQRILQLLLAERVSIRDLGTILEGIAEGLSISHATQTIAEHVRARLARQICAANQAPGGYLPLISLSSAWEQNFIESIVGEGDDRRLAMAPSKLQEFVGAVRDQFEEAAKKGELPVLMTSPMNRPFVRSIVERFRAHTTVMSQAEVHPKVRLKTISSI
ncbi:MAG: flhA [Proteobacteria bacterium]|nr:flhA [Pseudomonadota bacterium]